jgi:hypothetical protein
MPFYRLTAPGWENFSGNFGFGAMFEDGLSTVELTQRQIMRIGSSTVLVDAETGVQVGPSVIHLNLQPVEMTVPVPMQNAADEAATEEAERERLAREADERKAEEAAALAEAQRKAQEAVDAAVVYTRQELEAIAANDGIEGLRVIARPLGIKGKAIAELVNEILAHQAKLASA